MIKLNPLTSQYPLIIQLSLINKPSPKSTNFSRFIINPKLTLKCSVTSIKPVPELAKSAAKRNPYELVASTILKALKSMRKPMVALVFSLAIVSMLYSANLSLAASGGRMGGSSFSSGSSSSSRDSSSSSYPWSDSSSSSDSDSSSSSYSSSYDSSHFRENTLGSDLIVLIIIVAIIWYVLRELPIPAFKTVIKLQVGLLGSARSLQMDLNQIAKTADTSQKEGLAYILTETTVAMLRHPDYCVSGYSSENIVSHVEDCEEQFNKLSVEERGNLDKETLVNWNNTKKQSTRNKKSTGLNNEYIVITILVAAEGYRVLPNIRSIEDLKEALKMLGAIPKNSILAVEVLWTPQEENDTLTEREMLEKYPHLRLFK